MRLLVVLTLVLSACAPAPSPTAPLRKTGVDASSSSTPCAQACAVLQKAACEEGRPTKEGETCTELCSRISARLQDLHAQCVAAATDLAGIRACGVRCAQGAWAAP